MLPAYPGFDAGNKRPGTVLPFSKLNKMFLGYFDPENILLDNEYK